MPFRELLRTDLLEARMAQNVELVSLIRTLISSIDNAEAVDRVKGDAATEVPRRHLSEDDIMSIIVSEGDELRSSAADFERHGHEAEADRLRSLSEIADRYARTFAESRS